LTAFRTHTCGELRKEHVGQTVTLSGFVDRHAGDTFEVRDALGRTLVVPLENGLKQIIDQVNTPDTPEGKRKRTMPLESVVTITGVVGARPSADKELATGEVHVEAEKVLILATARSPLLFDFRDPEVPRSDRIRHRYLYLRNPGVHDVFAFRTRILAEMRRWLTGNGFREIDTPLLAARWRPDQPEALLALRGRREVFALPGKRPVWPTVLMASGFDRVFEVGRRFQRKPAYGPFQQPEFSVLDASMAFVNEADLVRTAEALLAHVWMSAHGSAMPAVTELTFDEAWAKYGSDAPDLRFDAEIQDATGKRKGGVVRAVRIAGGGKKLTPEAADELAMFSAARTKAGASIGWIQPAEEAIEGHSFAAGIEAAFDPDLAADLRATSGAKPGDLVFYALAKDVATAHASAAALRVEAGRVLALADPKKQALVRIGALPYLRREPGAADATLRGDPLSAPVGGDFDAEPEALRAQASYWVLNGVNVGGGSIRNHTIADQARLLERLGYGPEETDKSYSELLQVIRFGVPPHGRFAFGVDRLIALLRGLPSIDEVIPLPKTPEGEDPLARAPWPVAPNVLRNLLGL
jgi:aspartyl-tRNA synthetase